MHLNFIWFNGTDKHVNDAFDVRCKVFVNEQGFAPEIELDDKDSTAFHLIAYCNGKPIATLRMFEEDKNFYHVGRVAVLKQFRKNGVGAVLMQECEKFALLQGKTKLVLASQLQAKGFYQKLGYTAYGNEFCEGGETHQYMHKFIN